MGLKEIVVYVDALAECATRIRIAADLAHRHAAHLVGVYVTPVLLGHSGAAAFATGSALREMLSHHEALETERHDGLRRQFDEAAQRHGVIAEWRRVPPGADDAEKIMSARYADLAIVGQRDEEGYSSAWLSLLLASGSPTLVVPRDWAGARVGARAIVAWNASREARRATLDALPLLQGATATTIVLVDPRKGVAGHGEQPGADIARYLARHGVRAEVEEIVAKGSDPGSVIAGRATALQADLIVMGAYGHSRITELVLGGATRTMLKRMPVPVLMSH